MARIALLLTAVTLIAGITPIAARMATSEIPPMLIPLVRFGTAGMLLALTVKWLRLWKRVDRQHWTLLASLGFLCVPVNQVGYLGGIKRSTASHAGIAYALVPVLIYWISVGLRRARLSWRLAIASVLAFVGAALVSQATTSTQNSAKATFLGDALLLSAASSWSLFVVLSQPLVKELGAVLTLCLVFLLGTVFHLPVAAGESIWLANGFSLASVTWKGWVGLAYLTLITAYLNFLLWYVVTSRYDVTRSAVVTNAHFIVTVLVEYALFGLFIGWIALIGAALLLTGIALATKPPGVRTG